MAEEGPERSLSKKGISDVTLVAEHLSSMGLKVSRIYHSEKLRAKQTAQILQQRIKPQEGLRQVVGLAPSDDISLALGLIENAGEPIMIVGHLPHLSKLLSQLVVRNQERELLSFDAGGIVCVAKGDKRWMIRWILSARTLREQRR